MASPKDQQQNILHWGTGNDSPEMLIIVCLEKHLQNDVFFCRYPIILQCLHSMSATGRTDSASAEASWPNPNSTVLTHAAWRSLLQRCRSLAVSDSICHLQWLLLPLGNSLSAILDGEARLTFLNRGEDYVMNMPYAHCKGRCVPLGHAHFPLTSDADVSLSLRFFTSGILYGTMTLELGGQITVACEKTGYSAQLEFKLKVRLAHDCWNQGCSRLTRLFTSSRLFPF